MKTFPLIDVTLLGISMEVNPHAAKANLPIDFTLPGILRMDKLKQPNIALSPIDTTLLGISIEVKL